MIGVRTGQRIPPMPHHFETGEVQQVGHVLGRQPVLLAAAGRLAPSFLASASGNSQSRL